MEDLCNAIHKLFRNVVTDEKFLKTIKLAQYIISYKRTLQSQHYTEHWRMIASEPWCPVVKVARGSWDGGVDGVGNLAHFMHKIALFH